jgi:formyltetrahydrofolate deformylase
MPSYVLLADCRDAPGISAAVTGFLAQAGGFILDSQQHGDADTGRFFLRIAFGAADGHTLDLETLRCGFATVADRFEMRWTISHSGDRPRVVIAVSRFGHCLNDLLHRWRTGTLPVDVVAVVSNHDDMRALTEWHGLPYHHLPVTRDTKEQQEAAFARVIEDAGADLLVLARYMQVLSAAFSAALAGRCINIHHSFLPSFKGAKPYHQAYARGVKLIGATAHYVTDDLDEGPIIEQDVERVTHQRTAPEFVEIGQDIEARVLARAVRWHAERRVVLNGSKTVVFR